MIVPRSYLAPGHLYELCYPIKTVLITAAGSLMLLPRCDERGTESFPKLMFIASSDLRKDQKKGVP